MKNVLILVCLLAPMFSAVGSDVENADLNLDAAQTTWVTVGTDAMPVIRAEFKDHLWPMWAKTHVTNPEITIMRINEEQMKTISRLLHHAFGRCGGFMAHPSYEQAIASAHRELYDISQKAALSYTLDRATEVNAVLPTISEPNIAGTIIQLSGFSTRYYNTQTSVSAANWLKGEWEAMAAGHSNVSVSLFNHPWAMPSVVLTITGAWQPQDIIIMGGHLDSVNQSGSSAPGADDDASGIATLTEILRAALAQDYTPARTIKVIAYAAEEVGLQGSAAIADDAVANNDNIIGVLQLDMTNYKGSSTDIWLMTDYTNAAQNSFIGDLIDTYTSHSWSTSSCGYGCSDHASWHNRGFPASMPFESHMSQYNPYIHTANDTISVSGNDADHAAKFARMGAAYMLELGKGGLAGDPGADPGPVDGGGGGGGNELTNPTTLNNLSGASGSKEYYFIDVPGGASNLVIQTSGGSGDCDLYTKYGSAPTTSSYGCRPWKNGNNETCTVSSPSQGEHHIMLHGYNSYSGMTLSVSHN